ncbi:MAG: hypothetical protein HZB39_18600 [Planctomycetes bacterium]|nr:hypothetical protein [Planctomycetota bacterium]
MSGGSCLEDLEVLRNNEAYLDAVGTQRIPDQTTAGDFFRRFDAADVDALQDAVRRTLPGIRIVRVLRNTGGSHCRLKERKPQSASASRMAARSKAAWAA